MTTAGLSLLEEVQSIKQMLMARGTGGISDDLEYQKLRLKLMGNSLVAGKLPSFVRTCRTLDEFWPHIKMQDSTYAGRRLYLAEQFDPVLTFLEHQSLAPADDANSETLDRVDAPHVAAAWKKALDRRTSDPTGAITAARSLIETVCKHILDEQSIKYESGDDLPKLYKLTADSLTLSPSQHSEKLFRQILGGCQAVVEGLGAIRNRHSDAHGAGKDEVTVVPRHAELAVNLAGTMATFLLETWEWRRI